jgi:cytochrome c-type biogenesis protein CcmH
MNRRELLHRSGLASLGMIQATPRPDSAAADPLYRPDAVQSRAVATALDNDSVVKDIEHRLKCTCGCNLDIYTCRTTDFTCTYSPELHRELLALRSAGQSPEEVVAAFVSKYGEQVLMAPKPEGFNLAGYALPGALVLLAGTLLVWVVGRRARRALATQPPSPPPAPGTAGVASAEATERLRRALAEVED